MRSLSAILLFVLLSISTFAQEQWYFFVDERYPAESSLLKGKQRILVVNNALTQPHEFGHTTVLDGANQAGVQVDLTRAILSTLFTTTQSLEASGSFEVVELMDISQNHTTNYYARHLLGHTSAEELCANYQADALLILNQLVLYDVLESFPTEEGAYYAYLQAYAQSHWSVHYAGQSRDRSFTQSDTLLWESDLHYHRTRSLNDLPDRQEALLYLAQELGNRVANSFVPSWQTTRRYIYDHLALQSGLRAFRYQRWAEAIDYWRLAMGDRQLAMGDGRLAMGDGQLAMGDGQLAMGEKKAAACAAANIAIAYEMQGDYASACDYAQRAIRLFGAWKTAYARQQQANLRYYLAQLQARQARERDL